MVLTRYIHCKRFCLFAVSLFCAVLGATSHAGIPVGPLPDDARPLHYRISLDLDPRAAGFSGHTEIDISLMKRTRHLYLHGRDLNVERVTARLENGSEVAASYAQLDHFGVAELKFARDLPAGPATLLFDYRANYGTQPNGLHRIQSHGQSFLFTQFEAIDARLSFPGFDEPRFKTPFDIEILSPRDNRVVSNMPVERSEEAGTGRMRTVFARTPPLPTYLLFFGVGPFDVVEAAPLPPNRIRSNPVPLRGFALPGKGAKLRPMLDATASMVADMESWFDQPFPFPKLDLIASPDYPGAMENAGAIFYGETSLLIDEQTPSSTIREIANTHAHELSHQWFGDLVTPTWWDSIWLNESFAQRMGDRFANRWRADLHLENATLGGALYAMNSDQRASAHAIAQAVRHNSEIDGTFDDITYQKGAAVLAMFERYLGEERFRDGVRLHMRRFARGNASGEDFMRSLAEGSERPEVVPAFRSFIEQSGLPLLHASLDCDGAQPRVHLKQSRYLPLGSRGSNTQSWKIPACLELGGSDTATEHCLLMDKQQQTLQLDPGSACPSYLMPNAHGAGYYRFALDSAAWRKLLAAMPGLDSATALASVNNFIAAFNAGKVDTALLIEGLEKVAALEAREAALNPAGLYRQIDQQLLSQDSRLAFRSWLRSLYLPRFQRFGFTANTAMDHADPAAAALWRSALVNLLVDVAHEPVTSASLAQGAERYLAGASVGELQHDALDSELVQSALIAGVRERGPAFFEALLEDLLASSNSEFQQRAAWALGYVESPREAARVRALLLDERLGSGIAWMLAVAQSRQPMQRANLLAWMQRNIIRFGDRQSRMMQINLPWLAGSGCDATAARRAKHLFDPVVEHFAARQALREVIENIELCTARKQAVGPALDAIFTHPGV